MTCSKRSYSRPKIPMEAHKAALAKAKHDRIPIEKVYEVLARGYADGRIVLTLEAQQEADLAESKG